MDIVTRQQINVLIHMAKIDQDFALVEDDLIRKIAETYGFSLEEISKMRENPDPIGSFGALSDEKRFEYLYNLVHVMLVDGIIHPSEKTFCQNLAIKLGYRKDVVSALIGEMKGSTTHSRDALFEIAEKYKI